MPFKKTVMEERDILKRHFFLPCPQSVGVYDNCPIPIRTEFIH